MTGSVVRRHFSPHFQHVVHIKADPCQNLFTCNQKDCNMIQRGKPFSCNLDDTTVGGFVSTHTRFAERRAGRREADGRISSLLLIN